VIALVGTLLIVLGCTFYLAGTVGLIRFGDVFARIHALTKADNLGLSLLCAGLALLSGSLRTALLLAVVWGVGILASTVSAHLIARHARRDGRAS
jgi:multicomponent Na+:H+ antiporter subunit G